MAQYDNTNKGALWKKTAKSGLEYISGKVNVEGTDYNISMFTNDKQGNEARPDFNIVMEPTDGPNSYWANNGNNNQTNDSNANSGKNSAANDDLSIEDLPF